MTTAAKIELNKTENHQIAKNMRFLLDVRGVSESEMAQSLNIPVMTIRRLLSGETTDPRISTLKLIADFFNISIDVLTENHSFKSAALMNRATPRFVPVLGWNVLSNENYMQDINLNTWKEWHPVVLGEQTTLSNSAFGLESRPSMQPRFPIGTLFIIDSLETPMDGDMVLIKMKTNNSLSLRELVIDIPQWQLAPITTGSETILYCEGQHQILGIVVLTLFQGRKN